MSFLGRQFSAEYLSVSLVLYHVVSVLIERNGGMLIHRGLLILPILLKSFIASL